MNLSFLAKKKCRNEEWNLYEDKSETKILPGLTVFAMKLTHRYTKEFIDMESFCSEIKGFVSRIFKTQPGN